jgi:DegV family protein with EDD domain
MNTVLITDSHCDLPLKLIEEYGIPFIGPMCNFKGKEIEDDFGRSLPHSEFYAALRSGEMTKTFQISPYRYENLIEKYISEGKSIIYLGFSSALSGGFNSACMAKEELEKKYNSADITLIDTLSGTVGQGLLVYYAAEMLKSGCTKAEVVDWVENNKLKVNHLAVVDDLYHLKRGGRISNSDAFIGTLLSFKPILKINDEGKIVPVSKVRGRKKGIRTLVDLAKEKITNPEEQVVFISHGDCAEDAELLKELIAHELKVKKFIINYIGCNVGSHTGPGALVLCFLGQDR